MTWINGADVMQDHIDVSDKNAISLRVSRDMVERVYAKIREDQAKSGDA